jgi:hypothetical protein
MAAKTEKWMKMDLTRSSPGPLISITDIQIYYDYEVHVNTVWLVKQMKSLLQNKTKFSLRN